MALKNHHGRTKGFVEGWRKGKDVAKWYSCNESKSFETVGMASCCTNAIRSLTSAKLSSPDSIHPPKHCLALS